jgi:PadR family transcriptional regulator
LLPARRGRAKRVAASAGIDLLPSPGLLYRLLHMELSKSSAKVLRAFVEAPDEEQYGFGLMRETGVKSGSLYPILERFERLRWIEGHDEAIDERVEGRPRRRLYQLTALGEREARKAVAAFYQDVGRAPTWVPGIEGV